MCAGNNSNAFIVWKPCSSDDRSSLCFLSAAHFTDLSSTVFTSNGKRRRGLHQECWQQCSSRVRRQGVGYPARTGRRKGGGGGRIWEYSLSSPCSTPHNWRERERGRRRLLVREANIKKNWMAFRATREGGFALLKEKTKEKHTNFKERRHRS